MTKDTKVFSTRVFSGIQPSGELTLGNYLGALKRFARFQKQGCESLFCIVDLHAITAWQEPQSLVNQCRQLAAGFIAAGVDPKQSILFAQSAVPEHAQLAWVFNCVARIGWLNRMTQFKEKAGKNRENASVGLLAYPILMAADILLYRATHVPVGDDQKQHLELTRDIAQKFNNDFKVDFFPIVEPVIEGMATRVMSLRDGTKKMSKSDPSDLSRINLSDSQDSIINKITKAKTDPYPLPYTLDELDAKPRPEARNLLSIYAALTDKSLSEVIESYAGQPFSVFKPDLADVLVNCLAPVTREMQRLFNDQRELDCILQTGAEQARAIAEPILKDVYDVVGLRRL